MAYFFRICVTVQTPPISSVLESHLIPYLEGIE